MTITIHHLHISQSERIPWICEELSIPYNLQTYHRAPLFAPPEYKALHPVGSAPVIQDGDLTLAESGACMEYISHVHADGSLFLKPGHKDYTSFLYWWHFGNASLMPAVARLMTATPETAASATARRNKLLQVMEARLGKAGEGEWLAGEEFTAADIMVVFPLTTMRHFAPFSLAEYPALCRYLERIGQREAYKRTMAKIDPGMELLLGVDGPKQTFMEKMKK